MPRSLFILIAAAIFVGTVCYYSGIWWANVLTGFCADVFLILAWIVPAALLGWAIVRRIGVDVKGGLGWCTSAAIGLGIFSLMILGLGLAAWMNRFSAYGLLVVSFVVGCIDL